MCSSARGPRSTDWIGCSTSRGRDGRAPSPRSRSRRVMVRTLETTPGDATQWSTRSMAREVGLTESAVLRIWKAFGLRPDRRQTWKLSRNPQFIDPVRDIVGLYPNPLERGRAVRRSGVPDPGGGPHRADPADAARCPQRATHQYKRAGTSRRYAALDITHREGHRGAARPPPRDRVSEVPADHRPRSPRPRRLHLVLDNSSTPQGNANGWPRAVAHCSRPRPAPALRASGVVDACGGQRASFLVRCGGSASDPVQGLIVERLP